MATHYVINVLALNGEQFGDTVDRDLRGTLEQLAQDPMFKLGDKIAVRRNSDDPENLITYYYFHGGRITVTTRKNQYTEAQRAGRRRF